MSRGYFVFRPKVKYCLGLIVLDHVDSASPLKDYYEIVGESRPLSMLLAFFPTHADFVYRNAFLLMKLSNPPSFRAIRALIASQSTFEI